MAAATRSFTEGCALGVASDPANALESGQEWGRWSSRHAQWPEAVAALDAAAHALQDVVELQLTRQHKEAWLRDATFLATTGAYARVKAGRLEDAVVAFETGRAMSSPRRSGCSTPPS